VERVRIGEVELAYEEMVEGRAAVVLVHGLGGSAYGWRAQLAGLATAGYRTIAYDQRGAGRSDKPVGPYSVEGWADDLERLLGALEVDRAALVGHSVGTMVAEHAALRLGERCWALALVGGALGWPDEAVPNFERRAELARAGRLDEIAEQVAATGLSEPCRADRPELHGLFLAAIAGNDPDGYAESALATGRGSMLHPERIACPTLALCGELDPVTPPAASEAIAAAIPGAEAGVIEGAAHWCQLEAPAALNGVLAEFLRRHAA
jgi:3-oxoadipate enol-lactonase